MNNIFSMFDLNTTVYALVVVLALGTIYAWYQFALVLARQCDTCSVDLKASPFKSKCFVGAIFFSIAFVLALNT
ncbi:MAG: hypothetical protein NUV49_03280, partial [Patescibacteria group bacterium]|nr:hypothetical protein [Patescibacteria group bacterium]